MNDNPIMREVLFQNIFLNIKEYHRLLNRPDDLPYTPKDLNWQGRPMDSLTQAELETVNKKLFSMIYDLQETKAREKIMLERFQNARVHVIPGAPVQKQGAAKYDERDAYLPFLIGSILMNVGLIVGITLKWF